MPRLLTDPSVPQWVKEMGERMQANSDKAYDSQVADWKARRADWVADAQRKVDMDVAIEPFTIAPPLRVVFMAHDTQSVVVSAVAPADPQLRPPVMPSKTVDHTSAPLTTSDPTEILQQQLAMILNELVGLRSDIESFMNGGQGAKKVGNVAVWGT